VRLNDAIPAYRLSSSVTLPRIGSLASFWKQPLSDVMPEYAGNRVIFDLRSASYSRLWSPSADAACQVLIGRVMQRLPDGTVRVVSHHNKATKGRLVRDLSLRASTPRSTDDLIDLISDLGYEVNLAASRSGRPRHLDIVVSDV
jgi:uncharacterized protein